MAVDGDPVGMEEVGARVLGEFVGTVEGATTGAVGSDPAGAGAGAWVLGEFVGTVVGAATGAAVGGAGTGNGAALGTAVGAATIGGVKVGGGTEDGFTTPVEGVGPPLTAAAAVVGQNHSQSDNGSQHHSHSSNGPNNMLSEYHCLWIGNDPTTTTTTSSSQGFGGAVDGDCWHYCNK